jgi:flagellar hook-associated protein 2
MSTDYLTTSGINSLVESYTKSQTEKLVTPLTTKKTSYETLKTSYTTMQSKISALKSQLSDLIKTSSSSVLKSKTASSTDSTFVTATATGAASSSSYNLRVSQLAKSDVVISKDLTSATESAMTGTHSIAIKTGDGNGGEFISNVDVTFDGTETNQTIMQKIRNAINNDKAVVTSGSYVGTDAYTGGASTIKININGTETDVDITGGGTYSDLMDEMVSTINTKVSGVTASKVTDESGNVSLKLTVKSNSNYISISDVSGNALAGSMNIVTTQEKAASGCVNASVFTPLSTTSQLSLTAKNSGTGYRIKDISDTNGGTALASIGLNLGSSRPTYAQIDGEDTAGYKYADISTTTTLLDSKFTFNGLALQRDSNTISDLANGVSFTLKSVMEPTDTDITVSVSSDASTIKSKLQSFISSFNDLYTYLKSNTTTTSGTRGSLAGNSTATALIRFMSSTSYSQVSGLGTDALKTFAQIGITFDSTSGLTISDSSTLEDALTSNATQVEDLFNSSDGIASKLYNYITPYLGAGGYIDKTMSNLNTTISRVTDSITAAQTRIDNNASSLRSTYQMLQVQLANMYTLQSSISSLYS